MSAKHRMEEHLAEVRKVQKAKLARADNRAMELNDLRPSQGNQMLEPSVDGAGMSGGAAGLARVIGSGKRRAMKPKMEGGFLGLLASAIPLISSLFGKGQMTEDAHKKLMALMKKRKVGEHSKLSGGFWGALASLAVPLIGKLLGQGKMTQSAHDELCKCFSNKEEMKGGAFADAQFGMVNEPAPIPMEGGAKYGKMLREHFMKMKGSGFVDDFAQGFMGVVKPDIHSTLRGNMGATMSNAAKMRDREMLKSAGAGRAGAGKCKGGKEQEDAEMMMGDGMLGKDGKGQRKMAGGAMDARKARGQAVSRLMKEKGMSLGEASRYVKEHGF